MALYKQAIVLIIALAWVRIGHGQIVLNEILPDPAGSDGGKEFVEFYNTGSQTISLAGIQFQFANGAEDPDWETRWTGGVTDSIAAYGRFLLVDKNWIGEVSGDAEVRLALQNGPDAVRLIQGDQVLDLIGYGPLTGADFFETDPILLEPGMSLSRRPDGGDTNNNASDFRVTEPTPGQPNYLPYQMVVANWSIEPPSSDRPGHEHRIQADLINTGLLNIRGGVVTLVAAGERHVAQVGNLYSGQRITVLWTMIGKSVGRFRLDVEVPLGTGEDPLGFTLGFLQVGHGPLALNEIQPVPGQGQGEWVELASAVDYPLALEKFKIKDEDGSWHALPAWELEPGGLVVLAQEPSALEDWVLNNRDHGDPGMAGCPSNQLLLLGMTSWPTLNNTSPDSRAFADRIYLADSLGVVIDHITFTDASVNPQGVPLPGDGRSLERLSLVPVDNLRANWGPCSLGTGGTPGWCNSFPAVGKSPSPIVISSPFIDREAGLRTLGITIEVPAEGRGFGLQIFNLWGELVRDLGGDSQGTGIRVRYWMGIDDSNRPVPRGGYIIVGSINGDAGVVLSRAKILVGVR